MKPSDFFPVKDVKIAHRRWENTPTLMSHCPFKLSNGFQLDELTSTCAQCKVAPPSSRSKGDLEANGTGGFIIKTLVWCPDCNLFTYGMAEINPKGKTAEMIGHKTPPYWSPWGEDNNSVRGGFGR